MDVNLINTESLQNLVLRVSSSSIASLAWYIHRLNSLLRFQFGSLPVNLMLRCTLPKFFNLIFCDQEAVCDIPSLRVISQIINKINIHILYWKIFSCLVDLPNMRYYKFFFSAIMLKYVICVLRYFSKWSQEYTEYKIHNTGIL